MHNFKLTLTLLIFTLAIHRDANAQTSSELNKKLVDRSWYCIKRLTQIGSDVTEIPAINGSSPLMSFKTTSTPTTSKVSVNGKLVVDPASPNRIRSLGVANNDKGEQELECTTRIVTSSMLLRV